ncbi:MAG: hypothetical protein R2824_18105 [Saprospiraceae bacterium]|nr:hypothetical protein [Lewinella sp.]
MEKIFQYSWMAGLSFMVIIYATQFNELSEDEMVRWSYVWIPLLIFGIIGTILQKRAERSELYTPFRTILKRTLLFTLTGAILLVFFYEAIWPGL